MVQSFPPSAAPLPLRAAAFVVVASLAFAVCVEAAAAQILLEAGAADDDTASEDDQSGPATAFVLPLDEDLQNAIDDYARHANRGLWAKAVEAIEQLDTKKLQESLLAGSDGTIVSGAERLRQIQTELSAEGREAFRLFLGPKARKAFAEAMAEEVLETDRIDTLTRIRRQYFPSSVGDNATNLLGDFAFRNGRFAEAAGLWSEVLRYHPDSEISEARLHYKRGLAHSLAGNDREARVSLSTLRRRFPGETVTVGGEEIVAVASLAARLGDDEASPVDSDDASGAAFTLADEQSFEPLWQHQFIDSAFYDAISSAGRNSWRRPGAGHHVPPTAHDENIVAVNYLGAVSAIDLESGKLRWRYLNGEENWERFKSDTDELNFDNYHIAIGDGKVFAVGVPPTSVHYYGSRPELDVLDVDASKPEGNRLWSTNKSDRGYSSDGWFVVGTPTIIDGDLYYVAGKSSGYEVGDIFLRKHPNAAKSGTKDIRLGRYRSIGNTYNGRTAPTPKIVERGGEVVVYLDEGMMLALDESLQTTWGYRYESRPVQNNQNRFYSSNRAVSLEQRLQVQGEMHIDGTRAFLKDAHAPLVHEVDLETHKRLSTRSLPAESEIIAIDESRYFVLGETLDAYSRKDGSVLWSKRLKREAGGLSAVQNGGSLFIFTDTGLFEFSKADGKLLSIRRGADDAEHGGRVFIAGDKLITVSPLRITAYALSPAAGGEAAKPESSNDS